MKTLLLAVGLTLPVSTALAEPASQSDAPVVEATSLTEDQLRQAIIGKTIYLNVSGFELPIRYRANGRMTGSMGAVAATFSQGDGSRDSGRWWIEANQLCQRWTSWMDGQTHCYKITRQGNVIDWLRDDGVSGTARLRRTDSPGLAWHLSTVFWGTRCRHGRYQYGHCRRSLAMDQLSSPHRRALIVEDEIVIALGLQDAMSAMGFDHCDLAPSDPRARSLAMSAQPDIALVDVSLEGGREGIEAARWLREVCEVPVVFVTGYTDPDTIDRIHQQVPGAPVISKPDYRGGLADAVDAAIAHRTG